MPTQIVFDVHFTVPLKALDTLVSLANDLDCGLVSANPNPKLRPRPAPSMRRERTRAGFIVSMADAKAAVIERLKQEKGPVNRRIIIRDLRAKGFPKNSVGPLCTEMKRAGMIVNPRRGYWTLPGKPPQREALAITSGTRVNNTAHVNAALGAGVD